jgi:hypothetical protein
MRPDGFDPSGRMGLSVVLQIFLPLWQMGKTSEGRELAALEGSDGILGELRKHQAT